MLLLATIVAAVVFHPVWLSWLGSFLILADAPVRADLVVVLAGDWHGLRILEGARLVKEGYAPKVVVSSPRVLYGRWEDEFAIPFIVDRGYPREWFEPFRIEARSTREEVREVIGEMRRRGIGTVLVVTSDFHTRRARRLFTAESDGNPEIITIAAHDKIFRASDWWRSREGRKVFFYEWTKTLASMAGM